MIYLSYFDTKLRIYFINNYLNILKNMKKIRIILSADMQYKDRQYSLSNSYELVSNEIERILVETQADIYAFAGDFTEYPTPNDSERSLMFKHLGNALNITTLKEMVVMNGNHDLILGKKLLLMILRMIL